MDLAETRQAMWVCRAGSESIYYDYFVQQSRIFMPWDGFNTSLDTPTSIQDFRDLVISEKGGGSKTTISNLAGQLIYFSRTMEVNDYVLIPQYHSQAYTLAILAGEYEYCSSAELHHSRQIRITIKNIPRDIFPQSVIYSLGAFRTLFKVKQCNEVISTIKKWVKENTNG